MIGVSQTKRTIYSELRFFTESTGNMDPTRTGITTIASSAGLRFLCMIILSSSKRDMQQKTSIAGYAPVVIKILGSGSAGRWLKVWKSQASAGKLLGAELNVRHWHRLREALRSLIGEVCQLLSGTTMPEEGKRGEEGAPVVALPREGQASPAVGFSSGSGCGTGGMSFSGKRVRGKVFAYLRTSHPCPQASSFDLWSMIKTLTLLSMALGLIAAAGVAHADPMLRSADGV